MKIVVRNKKSGLEKCILISEFTKEQINQLLWFYNTRTNGAYEAYEID